MNRNAQVLDLPCVACSIEGEPQLLRTEVHHLNEHEMAGKKRRGDDYSIPLCGYHHRGELPAGMTGDVALFKFGPSLARSSKLFRQTYGRDDFLLSITNRCLESGAYQPDDEHFNQSYLSVARDMT